MTQAALASLTPWQPVKEPTWRRLQAKRAFEIVLGKMLQPEHKNPGDELVPYLRALNVQWEKLNLEEVGRMWAAPQEIEALELKQGDLLVCEGGEVGRAARIDVELPEDTIIQNALHRVRGSELGDVGYLSYCLRHAADSGWFDVICNRATIAHFTVEKFRDLWLNLPDLPTQRRIADFLDRETAQIDALIEAKEQMLALLQEKRAAQISHMVTKGLDPNVEMKDSGLEWLGRIPVHWKTLQLKRTLTSSDYGISVDIRGEGSVKVLRMSCIHDGIVDLENAGAVEDVDPYLLVRVNDVLFNRTNSLDQVGKVGLIDSEPQAETTFASYLVRLRFLDSVDLNYMVALLNSPVFLKFARANAVPAIGQANLNPTKYGEILIPLPPLEEQCKISNYVGTQDKQYFIVKDAVEQSLTLLRERRSALITAAVTGQLAEVLE